MKSFAFLTFFLIAAAAAAQADGDAANGAALFKKYCKGCHGADGRGGGHTFMPHVDRLTKAGYIDLLPDEYLAEVIAEGGAYFGKSAYMPSWKATLDPAQIQDLIAHIRTLTLH